MAPGEMQRRSQAGATPPGRLGERRASLLCSFWMPFAFWTPVRYGSRVELQLLNLKKLGGAEEESVDQAARQRKLTRELPDGPTIECSRVLETLHPQPGASHSPTWAVASTEATRLRLRVDPRSGSAAGGAVVGGCLSISRDVGATAELADLACAPSPGTPRAARRAPRPPAPPPGAARPPAPPSPAAQPLPETAVTASPAPPLTACCSPPAGSSSKWAEGRTIA